MRGRAKRPRSGTRWLATTLCAVATIELIYLAAGNTFLALNGAGLLMGPRSPLKLDYRSAFTVLPGLVELRGLRVWFEDSNVQWSLEVPRLRVRLRLAALHRRTFHAVGLTGDAAAFRMRHRLRRSAADSAALAALPDIRGVSPPLLSTERAEHPTAAPPLDPDRVWTIQLESVDVGLTEVWIQTLRYLGGARATGGFRLVPGSSLRVGPARLALSPGDLSVGGAAGAARLSGFIEGTIHGLRVTDAGLAEVLREASARCALSIKSIRLASWSPFFAGGSGPRAGSGEGELTLELRRGHLTRTSRAELRFEGVLAELPRALALEAARIDLLARADASNRAELSLRFGGARLTRGRPRPGRGGLAVARAELALTASTLDLGERWTLVEARLSDVDAHAHDLRAIPDLLGAGTRFGDAAAALPAGEVWFTGGARLVPGAFVSGALKARVSQARARYGPWNARFDARLSGSAHWPLAPSSRRRSFSLHLNVPRATLHGSASTLRVAELEASLSPEGAVGSIHRAELSWGDFHASGGLRMTATASSPTRRFEPSRGAPDALEVTLRGDELAVTSGPPAPDGWELSADALSVSGGVRWTPRAAGSAGGLRAPLAFRARRVAGRIGQTRIGTTLAARLDVSASRALSTLRLGGEVALYGSEVAFGGHAVDRWWARARLEDLGLWLRDGVDLEGDFAAEVKDGSPAVVVLNGSGELPGWASALLPQGPLTARGRLSRRCRLTEFDVWELNGGPLTASGRLQSLATAMRGAFLLRVAPLGALGAVGLQFDTRRTTLSLFEERDWLSRRLEDMRVRAGRLSELACL